MSEASTDNVLKLTPTPKPEFDADVLEDIVRVVDRVKSGEVTDVLCIYKMNGNWVQTVNSKSDLEVLGILTVVTNHISNGFLNG